MRRSGALELPDAPRHLGALDGRRARRQERSAHLHVHRRPVDQRGGRFVLQGCRAVRRRRPAFQRPDLRHPQGRRELRQRHRDPDDLRRQRPRHPLGDGDDERHHALHAGLHPAGRPLRDEGRPRARRRHDDGLAAGPRHQARQLHELHQRGHRRRDLPQARRGQRDRRARAHRRARLGAGAHDHEDQPLHSPPHPPRRRAAVARTGGAEPAPARVRGDVLVQPGQVVPRLRLRSPTATTRWRRCEERKET